MGAGLPIIQTLRDLRETGDRIQRSKGILSGTLSYLFNVWDGEQPFSALVRDAKAQGLHRAGSARRPLGHGRRAQADHPGARDGAATCELARRRSSKASCRRRSRSATAEEFLARVPEVDAGHARALRGGARARQGAALRRAARRRQRRATVGPRGARPLASLREHQPDRQRRQLHDAAATTDNPLVVRGPGAGPAVTAGGVFADLLRVCAYLGARAVSRREHAHRVRAGERRQRGRRVRRPRLQRVLRRRSRAPPRARRRRASALPRSPASSTDLPLRARAEHGRDGAWPPWPRRWISTSGSSSRSRKASRSARGSAGRRRPRSPPSSRPTRCSTSRSTTCACSSSRCRASGRERHGAHRQHRAVALRRPGAVRSASTIRTSSRFRCRRPCARCSCGRTCPRDARRPRDSRPHGRRCPTSSGSRPTSPDSSPAASPRDLPLIRGVAAKTC